MRTYNSSQLARAVNIAQFYDFWLTVDYHGQLADDVVSYTQIPCATPMEGIVSGKSYPDTMVLVRSLTRRCRLTRPYSGRQRGNTAGYNRSLLESQCTLYPSSHYFRKHNGNQPELF